MKMAESTRRWTIADWERLPYDGNCREVVAGELFVTPMPSPGDQIVVQRLWGCACHMTAGCCAHGARSLGSAPNRTFGARKSPWPPFLSPLLTWNDFSRMWNCRAVD